MESNEEVIREYLVKIIELTLFVSVDFWTTLEKLGQCPLNLPGRPVSLGEIVMVLLVMCIFAKRM